MTEVRIDKYLWSIRVFKTRSEATDACKGGKVRVNGNDINIRHFQTAVKHLLTFAD
mgnify:CR=1 FL=1